MKKKRNLKQESKLLKMEDISSFMESLPLDFLTVLCTNGLLRSITRKLGVPQRIRILTYAKFALHGSSPKLNPATGFREARPPIEIENPGHCIQTHLPKSTTPICLIQGVPLFRKD